MIWTTPIHLATISAKANTHLPFHGAESRESTKVLQGAKITPLNERMNVKLLIFQPKTENIFSDRLIQHKTMQFGGEIGHATYYTI